LCQQVHEVGESKLLDCTTKAKTAQASFQIMSRDPAVEEENVPKTVTSRVFSPSRASQGIVARPVAGPQSMVRGDLAGRPSLVKQEQSQGCRFVFGVKLKPAVQGALKDIAASPSRWSRP
jgi:hypothetical protein